MGLFDRLAATLTGGESLPDEARDELAVALAFADRGDFAAAEERLRALADAHPRAVAPVVALGEVRARRGDDDGAVTAFGRAVDLSADAVDAWLGLGEALVRLRRADPARDALRRVLSAAPDAGRRARAHAGRGRLALAAGEATRAARELRQAAELAPEDFALAADLGRALVAAGDPEGAPWLLRAAQGPGADAALVVEAARAAGKPEAAIGLLENALRTVSLLEGPHPGPGLKAALARHLAEAGRLDEALAAARDALAGAPAEAAVVAAWQAVAEARGDYVEALRAAGRHAELVRGAAAAAEQVAPPPETLVRLALGAEDREALARVAGDIPAAHPLAGALAAFVAGSAKEDELVLLGMLAPSDGARRFVARAASPGVPPAGNLYGLLEYARDLAARTPELAPLLAFASRAAEAFDRPLLIAVMGEFNAGKSSFVNALCGSEVAPVGVTPTTATINVLRHGPAGGRVVYHDGRAAELGADEVAHFLGRLRDDDAAAVRTVEIFFPLDFLRRVEIVDTPGLNSLRTEHERVARGFLTEADAIVWLFAVGQAAKASERDALALAHAAHKRVLGVLNKADQVSADELAAIREHVARSLGDAIEVLLPLSARDALAARKQGDAGALATSGLAGVQAALDERFFAHSRGLKRATALAALGRFAAEARTAVASIIAPPPTAASIIAPPPTAASIAATPADAGTDAGARFARERQALAARESEFRGVLAAERLALPARLQDAFRRAASEVLDLVQPSRWPLGGLRAEAADHEFLADVLEDGIVRATAITRAALAAAAAGGPPVPIDVALDRFVAYAHGVLAGGLIERFLRDELPAATRTRADLPALQRSLARGVPDAGAQLFEPLAAEATAAYARARAALDDAELRGRVRALVTEARVGQPLAALADAVAALAAESAAASG